MSDRSHDIGMSAVKVGAPAALWLGGWTLNEWVAVATLVYLAGQTAYLIWKWRREWRAKP